MHLASEVLDRAGGRQLYSSGGVSLRAVNDEAQRYVAYYQTQAKLPESSATIRAVCAWCNGSGVVKVGAIGVSRACPAHSPTEVVL